MAPTQPAKPRLVSLDVFRGLAIGGMILTNNPGDYEYIYPGLDHAEWHGWTPVDLIFPFFLFIVGVSIALALERSPDSWLPSRAQLYRILKRGVIMFALGLAYNGFPYYDLSSIRIMGVLQRIALVYVATCLLHLALRSRWLLVLVAAILLGYWGLMTLMPVPGLGHPSLDKETNLVAWLDQLLMRGHLWEYDIPWDPEGLLSTLPALCLALLGLLAGRGLRSGQAAQAWRQAAWGAGLLGLGLLWDQWFPINKGLCTSSFVCFAGGAALLMLAACHWWVDLRGQRWGISPFLMLGMNPLSVYLASEMLEKIMWLILVEDGGGVVNLHVFLYRHYMASWLSPFNASLGWGVFIFLLNLGLAWVLYRRRIFIKI